MNEIHLLDHDTIDKIAAGEVVERPSSVVKELVENAIDAGSDAITVEIKEGGTSFIRVTDNGCGIDKSQIEKAFIRHATSKIRTVSDLDSVLSLGFRGEALSSIAAVAAVEMITKTKQALMGVRCIVEGAVLKEMDEVGAPDGTTIVVRNLFYNTPVRKKFLKQPMTEGGYVSDLMEHMALSKPYVSFKYIVNGQIKFHTTGSGDLKEIIYRIFGRDIAGELLPIEEEYDDLKISGFLGKPTINRSNRNFENYFVNGRFIKSSLLAKAIEEGYKGYLMQHKYPFCVLHFDIQTGSVDVNVHPTKMDVRFTNGELLFTKISKAITKTLSAREMIPEVVLEDRIVQKEDSIKESVPEPFETNRIHQSSPIAGNFVQEEVDYQVDKPTVKSEYAQNPVWNRVLSETPTDDEDDFFVSNIPTPEPAATKTQFKEKIISKPLQMELFEEKILTKEARSEYSILGQIFDTYWLFRYQDKLLIMDQHAAHEKVKYETFLKALHEKNITSQMLNPPVVVSLNGQQETLYKQYEDVFATLGFEIEEFGGNEYAIRAVPTDLYGCSEKELFENVMDELTQGPIRGNITVIEEKIASMSCKAAVKGNMSMSTAEVEALLDQLLKLDNPYHCPHGRPTMISMSKYELEKKFKRIV